MPFYFVFCPIDVWYKSLIHAAHGEGKNNPHGGCFLWRNYTLLRIISTMTTSLEKEALAVCTGANFGMDHK